MQRELINLYKKLSDSDTIFHYTKTDTALNYILDTSHHNFTLKMSRRTNGVDLWEQNNDFIPIKFDASCTFEQINNQLLKDSYKKFVEGINTFNQVSFCMNKKIYKASDREYYYKNLDKIGFLKARMWDQYGNVYKGVCLAFSKKQLIANNPDTIHGSVAYEILDNMPKQSFELNSSDIDQLRYTDIFNERLKKILFSKTLDYKDENEFRIGSFSNSLLNVANGLKAIVFIRNSNHQHPQFIIRSLANYARMHKIYCIELQWNKNGFGHAIYS